MVGAWGASVYLYPLTDAGTFPTSYSVGQDLINEEIDLITNGSYVIVSGSGGTETYQDSTNLTAPYGVGTYSMLGTTSGQHSITVRQLPNLDTHTEACIYFWFGINADVRDHGTTDAINFIDMDGYAVSVGDMRLAYQSVGVGAPYSQGRLILRVGSTVEGDQIATAPTHNVLLPQPFFVCVRQTWDNTFTYTDYALCTDGGFVGASQVITSTGKGVLLDVDDHSAGTQDWFITGDMINIGSGPGNPEFSYAGSGFSYGNNPTNAQVLEVYNAFKDM
jgi:hypothetical protein